MFAEENLSLLTAVQDSFHAHALLPKFPHQVLNARHEEQEAILIAHAGDRRAVTISTNMAGRGIDIKPGPGCAELGGLHILGTNPHEARRFIVLLEDSIMVRYGEDMGRLNHTPESVQCIVEGKNLEIRSFCRNTKGHWRVSAK